MHFFLSIAPAVLAHVASIYAAPLASNATTDEISINASGYFVSFGTRSINGVPSHVAWIEGQSACKTSVRIDAGGNPCDRFFELKNKVTYQLKGCGGPISIVGSDGFQGSCSHDDQKIGCNGQDITKEYICG